jgi:alpha-L-glutamate ligase-like protein
MKNFIKKIEQFKENVVGINHRNLGFIYPNNQRKHFKLSDDKSICKEHLHQHDIPTTPTYVIIESLGELEEKWLEASKHDTIAVKPAKGRGGGGILILKKTAEGSWKTPSGRTYNESSIFSHLANIVFGVYSFGTEDKAIIEYCINNHELFQSIYPNGIPDIRIIAYQDQLIMGMIRIPTDKSDGKGNLHQGALGVALDITTGIIGKGFDGKNHISTHPDSGVNFEGLQIPYWIKILDIATRAAKSLPLKYLGLDIVIDFDLGPLIIEVNARPGLEIQNVNQIGLLKRIEQLKILS